MEPTRARPVPFCRQSLRPAPLTSLLSLVLCVPARRPRRYHREASCNRCGFTLAPKTASASSTWPTFLPSRFTTSTTGMISFPSRSKKLASRQAKHSKLFGRLRLADKNVRSAGPWHRSPHQQQVFVGIDLHDLQILCRHLRVSHVTRKVLVLPYS